MIPRITININEVESSKYEGKPLIEPKIPYQFKVKEFQVDKNWSRSMRYQKKLAFIFSSFIEYLEDIVYLRTDPFVFKTA